ncbi:amidase [Acidisoma cellulosilytica]|uniref:Amidase n=1 Tax=Acidisoma cellulosilyticum TaxID=2802395 RepID=A0A963Z4B8_9PROT|nr:amidase [Acidisoma cellulosilyticum]MCB8882574.1 amidase [Acidisoma cellulosilyticum]
MTGMDLAFATIPELGAALRAGKVSAVELAQLCLARLERDGRRLNAVVTLTPEIALREAALADAELRNGLDRGPLHGIPYGMKDIVAVAGVPTSWGAAPFRDQVLAQEATVTKKLRGAGAVLVTKLATVELAGGMGYKNPAAAFTGPTANPWDEGCWTSGSSSGPGAAIAAGAVPFAIGSDTSGSILFPAAFTGVAGLRATYGRVSRHGAMTLCWTLDRLGPMARTAEDCGLVLDAIAGHDPADHASLREPYRYGGRARRKRGFRFGVIEGCCEGIEPEVQENFEATLDLLRQIGTLDSVELPDFPYGPMISTIVAAEAYAAFDDFIAAGGLAQLSSPLSAGHRLAASILPAHDYIRAQRIRHILASAFTGLAAGYDALLAPSLGVVATGLHDDFELGLPRALGRRPLNLAGVLTGSPTISVINGFGAKGLPTGIQFAGAPLSENVILDAASALEDMTDWASRRPPNFLAQCA